MRHPKSTKGTKKLNPKTMQLDDESAQSIKRWARMNETSTRMMERDHKHHTGSNAFLARFNRVAGL